MTDLELLKLSADAAGVDVEPYTWNDGTGYDHEGYRLVGTVEDEWNPLEDSEQALRILARLSLDINYRMVGAHPRVVASDGLVSASCRVDRWDESDANGIRRAIVTAAADACELPEQSQREEVASATGLTDDQLDRAIGAAGDALIDYVHEYGVASEGITRRIRAVARAAIEASAGGGLVSRLDQGESECPYTDQSPYARSAWLDGWEAAERAHGAAAAAAIREMPTDQHAETDCLMCSQVRLMYGVVACGSTVKCVGANQFKGRLTRVQLWKE